MELKDFNIFNLSLQQKRLLKKKVGQGGESSSADGLATFLVYSGLDKDGDNAILFELVSGTPRKDEDEDLLIANFVSKRYNQIVTVEAHENYNQFIIYYLTYSNGGTGTVTLYNFNSLEITKKLFTAKVGDIISFKESSFEVANESSYDVVDILPDKRILAHIEQRLVQNGRVTFVYNRLANNSAIDYGYMKKLDKQNNLIYISINDEVWKYSYQLVDDGYRMSFTFVEVVQ